MTRLKSIPQASREAVAKRSKGVCEGCGLAPAVEVHHRRYRSRGGGHEVSNLLHLCGSGNHTGCHGTAHSLQGEMWGWSIRSGVTAPGRFRLLYRGVVVVLTDDGAKEEVKVSGHD